MQQPPRQPSLTLAIGSLRLSVPLPVVVALVVVLVPGAALWGTGASPKPPEGPAPIGPQVPLQAWASSIPSARVLATSVLTKLPSPLPNQKTSKCDDELGEEEIAGGCWMVTDKKPPCPPGKLWEHEGRCWRPIPYSARPPTTGEPRSGNVAGEP
jgi:hypothetical protein